ncbi:MAG: hypothetical protein LQ338_007610 [Usnochroma carphineum]|nr:MAG: hypothetical protein LQ338_007610 [Usnochroma carphineum]
MARPYNKPVLPVTRRAPAVFYVPSISTATSQSPQPTSFHQSPREPHAIKGFNELLSFLIDLEAGRSPRYQNQQDGLSPDCLNFNIGAYTLPQLLEHLQDTHPRVKTYLEEELRYEFITLPSGENIFSMPKPKRTHRFLATVVEHRASAGIHKLASEERLSKAVKKEINAIRPLRDPDIKVSGPGVYNVLIPDIAFQPHAGSGYPTFVAEVANSEQEVDLIAKASRYLLKTHGNVRCVLGLKIRYPPGPRLEGWIYLWEAKENPDGSYAVVTVINRRQFMPYEGWDTLLLKLQYFLSPETTLPNHVQNLEIQIPLSDLADELADEQRADQPTDERNRELKRAGKTDVS